MQEILPESGSTLQARDLRLPGPSPLSPSCKKSGGQALGSRLVLPVGRTRGHGFTLPMFKNAQTVLRADACKYRESHDR